MQPPRANTRPDRSWSLTPTVWPLPPPCPLSRSPETASTCARLLPHPPKTDPLVAPSPRRLTSRRRATPRAAPPLFVSPTHPFRPPLRVFFPPCATGNLLRRRPVSTPLGWASPALPRTLPAAGRAESMRLPRPRSALPPLAVPPSSPIPSFIAAFHLHLIASSSHGRHLPSRSPERLALLSPRFSLLALFAPSPRTSACARLSALGLRRISSPQRPHTLFCPCLGASPDTFQPRHPLLAARRLPLGPVTRSPSLADSRPPQPLACCRWPTPARPRHQAVSFANPFIVASVPLSTILRVATVPSSFSPLCLCFSFLCPLACVFDSPLLSLTPLQRAGFASSRRRPLASSVPRSSHLPHLSARSPCRPPFSAASASPQPTPPLAAT